MTMEPAETVADRIMRDMFSSRSGGGNSTITVHHDGKGTWIAVTACLVMLGVMIVGGVIGSVWLSREFARVDKELNERKEEGQRMQSYLSAIYIQAPQLKPTEEDESAD